MNGTVIGDESVGGLIGNHTYEWAGNSEDYALNINNNSVSASSGVTGNHSVGGLIGYTYIFSNTDGADASLIMDIGPNNAVLADVTGEANDVGGLIGNLYYEDYNNFTFDFNISQSFVRADVSAGNNNAGGLIGSIDMRCNGMDGPGDNCDFKVNISDAYYNGNVSGNSNVGGLIGYSFERDWAIETLFINRAYATGTVTADINDGGGNIAGGFIGWSEIKGTIADSFVANSVDGNGPGADGYVDSGAFVGGGYPSDISFSNSYFDQAKNPEIGIYSALKCTVGGNAQGCSAVNTDGSNPNYFFNNYTNHPFDNSAWRFDGEAPIWKTNITSYPTLKNFINTTGPTFEVLGGGDTRTVNIDAGQVITTNPYIIKVKPSDSSGVTKVEFYIDDILICTDTTADADGYHTCSWDTSKYHSEVKIIAYNTLGNSTTLTRSTTVSLTGVPNTGLQPNSIILPITIITLAVVILAISRKRYTNEIKR
jgi:hypothetical protein